MSSNWTWHTSHAFKLMPDSGVRDQQLRRPRRRVPAQPALLDRRKLYRSGSQSAASHIEAGAVKNRPHLGEWERAIEGDELPAIDVEG